MGYHCLTDLVGYFSAEHPGQPLKSVPDIA